jgi:UDP-glucose 4-epimerase
MTTCLVTGGAGFIGSHLVERLVSRGIPVRVVDDLRTGRLENLHRVRDRVEIVRGSILDPALMRQALRGVKYVFHLAALPSVQRSVEDAVATHEVCATGTLHVLEAARAAGVQRLVYAASSSAYGGLPGAVRRERDRGSPLSPYAAAKLAGEYYCQCFTATYGLETVRLRFFNVFGPRQRAAGPYAAVIPAFVAAMLKGQRPTVTGDGLQSRDFTYVENAVQALEQAATAPSASGGVYNVGGGAGVSVLDVIDALNGLLGARITPVHVAARSGDVRHSQADLTLAKRDLGYEPQVAIAEGLRLTLEAAGFQRPGGL